MDACPFNAIDKSLQCNGYSYDVPHAVQVDSDFVVINKTKKLVHIHVACNHSYHPLTEQSFQRYCYI